LVVAHSPEAYDYRLCTCNLYGSLHAIDALTRLCLAQPCFASSKYHQFGAGNVQVSGFKSRQDAFAFEESAEAQRAIENRQKRGK
jgi:hypothetical protein